MGILKSNRRAVQARRRQYDAAYGALAVNPWWDPNGEGLCAWSAYQPVGAASFVASLVDLSGNGNNAGDPGGAGTPAWDAVNGWHPDGIATYLTTTFVPQNDQSQTVIIQFTNLGNANFALGVSNGAGRQFYIRPDTGANRVRYADGGLTQTVPLLAAGNLAVVGGQGYRNGIAEGPAAAAWGGASALPMYIGCWNSGAPLNFCDIDIQALVLYDCILTAPQTLAVVTAMAAL